MPDKLNPAQREAVNTLSGPLLVLAGAGTGKTRVVTLRIVKLIRSGIKADRILAVTFTNKAAAEMRERVQSLMGRKNKTRPQISTFHSYCVKLLRRHITRLGYPQKFAICDRGDQESIARGVLREIRVADSTLRPGDLLAAIGGWKSRGVAPAEAGSLAATDKEHLAAMAFRRYQRTLKTRGAVDFDDLLLLSVELLSKHPEVRQTEAGLFDHLLVDEYQDTNGSQYQVVRALAGGHRNLCVVGDDDQSIYGWRGAEVQHILRFHKDWPEAKIVRLEENYRSTAAILEQANTLIAYNKHRHEKTLRAARHGGEKPQILQYPNETVEAKSVVQNIQSQMRTGHFEYRDFAILFRTNEQPRAFEAELRAAKVPYVLIGGKSFYDRKEVRDVLSYLKVLASPQDEIALLRIINNPPRGIGQTSVKRLQDEAVKRGEPIWNVISNPSSRPKLSGAAEAAVERFVQLIRRYEARLKKGALADVARELVAGIGYEGEIRRLYPEPTERQSRWSAVEEVINSLALYEREDGKPTLLDFLDNAATGERDFGDSKDNQMRGDAVVLLTMHSAKGLEFPQVYMVGMEEGLLPHRRSVEEEGAAIDEERRLAYVGITRAQERLTLSMALTRMKWGKPRESIPSRFLFEIIGKADNPATIHAKQKAKRRK